MFSRTAMGKMLFVIIGAVGELERDLIRERTETGRQVAPRRGVKFRSQTCRHSRGPRSNLHSPQRGANVRLHRRSARDRRGYQRSNAGRKQMTFVACRRMFAASDWPGFKATSSIQDQKDPNGDRLLPGLFCSLRLRREESPTARAGLSVLCFLLCSLFSGALATEHVVPLEASGRVRINRPFGVSL